MLLICFALKFIHEQIQQNFSVCVCVYVSGQTTCMATLPLLSLGHNVKHNKRMPQEKSVCQATDKYSHTAAAHVHTHPHIHNSSNVKMESTCAYKPTPTLPPCPSTGIARLLVPQATNPFRLLFLTCATTTKTTAATANQILNTHTHSRRDESTHTHTHTKREREREIHTHRPLFWLEALHCFLIFASLLSKFAL